MGSGWLLSGGGGMIMGSRKLASFDWKLMRIDDDRLPTSFPGARQAGGRA